MAHQQTIHRACPLCEAICGLEITVEDGAVTSIRGDREDPFSRGHICPKAAALKDIHEDPDRLKHPVRRTDSGAWERISWRDAFDETADRLAEVQRRHGRDAVAVYLGNPSAHNLGTLLYGGSLWRALCTKNRFSATSVDQLPHHLAATLIFGHQLLLPIPDVDRTGFLLVLGANPVVSNGSLMTAPGISRRLKELRRRGGKVVVVDPRRTETAAVADRHHFIRPGTDALLLMALIHTVFDGGLDDLGHLAACVTSVDKVRSLAAGFPAERVSGVTGIAADDIRRLAREFASAESAVCYGRLGVSTQDFGALCQWLVIVLNAVTGNLDRPGGAMFTRPAVDLVRSTGSGTIGRWQSRVRRLPSFASELPVAALAEEITTPGRGQVRTLLTVAGNPVLSTPNGVQLDRALAGLDFMASVDFYLNETTRHAHIILPPTGPLEHDHYDLVFNLLAVRNVARYSPAVLAPGPDTRHDWQILEELRRRVDRRSIRRRFPDRIKAALGPRRLLDLGLRTGPYGAGLRLSSKGLTMRRLERKAHGLDLGPLEPCLPDRLHTDDGRIDLAPDLLTADVARLEATLERDSADGRDLQLIGRRHLRSNNSWMHNFTRLVRGRDRCTLLIHPADAERLGVADGAIVRISSRVGRIEVAAEVTEEVMGGVVSLPHGWGHDRPGTRLSVASSHAGASSNDLTDENEVDPVIGTAILNGVPVRVEALAHTEQT